MKILVPVKRVIDPYVKIRIKTDESDVETQNVKMSMNPFDEIALEEAVRIKEQGGCEEVIVISIGSQASQETLRHGLALGADRAVHILHDEALPSLEVAKILQIIALKESVNLVVMGKQAIDGDNNQTPQMLSALLDWPQATNISKLTYTDGSISVIREVDGGLESLELSLPAVVSSDLRLNEPRYASLPNIMKAKRKPLEAISLIDLGFNISTHSKRLSIAAPAQRSGGKRVDSVEDLVDCLRHEAKIL